MHGDNIVRLIAALVFVCPLVLSVTVSPALSEETTSPPAIRLAPQLLPEYKARVLSRNYRSAVASLQDAAEFPQVARDYCIASRPRTRQTVASLYDSWERRNAPFLAKAREQVKRAAARLRDEGVPLSDFGTGTMRMLKTTPVANEMCRDYAGLLDRREKLLGAELQQVLEAVTTTEVELANLVGEQ
jgi:hypothetical protein